MNQEPENKITEHELDDMLRRVQVPADLKDRLLKIPHTVQQDQPRVELPDTASPEPQHTRWLPYVLVATLLIIAGIVATQWLPDDATNTPNVIATKQNDNNEPFTHDLTDPPPWEVDIIDRAFPTVAQQVDGSPTLQAGSMAAGPEFLIVTRGRSERINSSNELAASVDRRGGQATVVDVSPYDHGEVSTMLGIPGELVVTPIVDEFLAGCTSAPLQ